MDTKDKDDNEIQIRIFSLLELKMPSTNRGYSLAFTAIAGWLVIVWYLAVNPSQTADICATPQKEKTATAECPIDTKKNRIRQELKLSTAAKIQEMVRIRKE